MSTELDRKDEDSTGMVTITFDENARIVARAAYLRGRMDERKGMPVPTTEGGVLRRVRGFFK